MATELYGVDARLIASIANTPVSTETNIIFIGASPSGDLNEAHLITSMSEYASKLGGAPGDGYNLTEAAIAAFQIAGINKCYMIPVSNSSVFNASDYTGNAELYTGVYAIEKMLMDNPTAVNVIVAPSITDETVLAALDGIAKLAAGHWQSFLMYDVEESGDQINSRAVAQADEIVEVKQLSDGHALAVWGHVKTAGGYIVSGAAIRACLQAISDANYNAPGRSGGNLAIPAIQGVCLALDDEEFYSDSFGTSPSTAWSVKNLEVDNATVDYNDEYEYSIAGVEATAGEISDDSTIINNSGKVALRFKVPGETALSGCVVTVSMAYKHPLITIPESVGNELSADGICSYNYYGNGVYHTWGDHTSLFAGGTVSDELYRFDNYIRVQMMIANKFQLTWRFDIDDPMDLAMRNNVITYEQNELYKLKSNGVLIGNPVVEFRADRNSTSDMQMGRFVWSFACTETPPAKYMKAEIAYTTAGLSVLTQAE